MYFSSAMMELEKFFLLLSKNLVNFELSCDQLYNALKFY